MEESNLAAYVSAREKLFSGSEEQALASLRRLAEEKGFPEALVLIGWVHHTGFSVPRDIEVARKCWLKASGFGSPSADYYLGRLAESLGETRQAFQLFSRSAEQRYFPSYYRLGLAYAHGLGVPLDYVKARYWLEQACDKSHRMALKKLAMLEISGRYGLLALVGGIVRLVRAYFLLLFDLFALRYSPKNLD